MKSIQNLIAEVPDRLCIMDDMTQMGIWHCSCSCMPCSTVVPPTGPLIATTYCHSVSPRVWVLSASGDPVWPRVEGGANQGPWGQWMGGGGSGQWPHNHCRKVFPAALVTWMSFYLQTSCSSVCLLTNPVSMIMLSLFISRLLLFVLLLSCQLMQ